MAKLRDLKFRVTPEYAGWLASFAGFLRLGSISVLVDQALTSFAHEHQFPAPPDRLRTETLELAPPSESQIQNPFEGLGPPAGGENS
jgi:hypothetical protein